ncbi:hypothetical protein [Loktanella sp. SALINAS62]|uniref:hypothetical protein n=1 Tax=Loktanella sp. SALINAS62 TaxID=2706124 RepID=UPI00201241A0|nr:hypothetical protein [Loktanella sp. SALINAS62]
MPDRRPTAEVPQNADIWHDQINRRLAGIERMLRRLEWQVWALCCGAGAPLILHFLHILPRG